MNTRRGFGRGDDDPGRRARSEDERRRWERPSPEENDRAYGDWHAEAPEYERGPYWEERYSGRPRAREGPEFGTHEPRYTREIYGRGDDPTLGSRYERGSYARRDDPTSGYRYERGSMGRNDSFERPYEWRRVDLESTRWNRPTTRLHALGTDGYWQEPVSPYTGYERPTFAGRWFDDSLTSESTGRWSGVGPRSYKRSDDRIQDEINERLTRHPGIDASDIDVNVSDCEVDLKGTVADRHQKRLAEDVADSVYGVREVNNALKVSSGHPSATPPTRVGMARNLVGGVVPTQIHPDMAVLSSDSQQLGKVKEVRRQHFLLDRPMARDVYVPLSSVLDVRANQVVLSIIADRVDQMGWARAGEEAELEVPRS